MSKLTNKTSVEEPKMHEADATPPKAGKYDHLPTKSAKIRAMAKDGMQRGQIAKALGIKYQFVRNVLITPVATPRS